MNDWLDYLRSKLTVRRINQIQFSIILLFLVSLLFKYSQPVAIKEGSIEWADWTGIGADSKLSKTTETRVDDNTKITTIEQFESGKTLWDWLSVLIIPASLAALGFWLQKYQQQQSDKNEKLEKDIAETNLREEALQTYLDRVSILLLDPTFNTLPEDDPTREAALKVIHARTLSILRRLGTDSVRKGSVIRFLIDTELIYKMKLNLETADLSGADLSFVDLSGANLKNANLHSANLLGATLKRANLKGANLKKAMLVGAKFDEAILHNADLSDANLNSASFTNASIISAILWDADLTMADLAEVKNLEVEQIKQAKNWKYAFYSSEFRTQLGL